jgi:hypothetical protein
LFSRYLQVQDFGKTSRQKKLPVKTSINQALDATASGELYENESTIVRFDITDF